MLDNAGRQIGYRLSAKTGSKFELRRAVTILYPSGQLMVTCPNCPAERAPMIETLLFDSAAKDFNAPEKHPPAYRFELLNDEAKAANTVTISEPLTVEIGPLKGWAAAIELVHKTTAGQRSAFVYSYVHDNCLAGFFMFTFDIDAKSHWLPQSELIAEFKAALASFSIETFDPASDPAVAAELKKKLGK
ncbi:MAG TPA: hypothetical protein PK264_11750 [Hyphomicrobiaceae bacterium]|nr:hypothetical protein [Hyphomicrobiaceae bacterium]